MEFHLISGQFSQAETIDILTKMTQVKIDFHTAKIEKSASEEDIKNREKKIKFLQNNLAELRNAVSEGDHSISVNSVVSIN